jgi:SAM-dependent methyltransferase
MQWLEPYQKHIQDWVKEERQARDLAISLDRLKLTLVFGPAVLLCYLCVIRSSRFGLAVGAMLLAASFGLDQQYSNVETLLQTRSFYGTMTVQHNTYYNNYLLMHGTTTHGMQVRDPEQKEKETEPLTYYHLSGPVGQAFEALNQKLVNQNWAVVGLGSGTMALYGRRGQHLTFYDIDPEVVRIATNPNYFTNLRNCRAEYNIVLGDARLQLARAEDAKYALLAVDAFSSDAIPMHLITREALELYFQKLKPDGVLLVHISNRYLNLAPVLGNLADDLGLDALWCQDSEDSETWKYASEWVALARKPEDLGTLVGKSDWTSVPRNPKVGVWTDDYSNLLSVLSW